jgi:haloalkane dehalogenase
MQVLRTPDSRFENLPGWTFEPRYAEITDAASGQDLRMAYVDEGPRDGRTVLLLHGEPSWSYLYRHMIPALVAAGHRVLAPDLIGFGRSDKPADRDDYTYERHVAWLSQWFTGLGLQDATLFCQDWGGLLGLRLVAAFPERFAGVVVANTGLPVGTAFSEGFAQWLAFSQSTPDLPIGRIVDMGTARTLSEEEIAAYDAPFPDESYKEGARQFPLLVPTSPDDPASEANRAAWKTLEQFDRPVLCAFSDRDPITGGADRVLLKLVPGTKGQPHTTIVGGGHFLQEDRGEELARVVVDFIASTPGAA